MRVSYKKSITERAVTAEFAGYPVRIHSEHTCENTFSDLLKTVEAYAFSCDKAGSSIRFDIFRTARKVKTEIKKAKIKEDLG